MIAAREGHLAIVKILINHGANVNNKNMSGKFFILWNIILLNFYTIFSFYIFDFKNKNTIHGSDANLKVIF